MAAKKWPKWVIGLSSIGLFSGALYAMNEQNNKQPTNNVPQTTTEQKNTVVNLTDTITVTTPDMVSFLEQMTEKEKAEREKQLNEWFTNTSSGTYETNIETLPASEVNSDRDTGWS